MAEIFLSYASPDRPKAKMLAGWLETQGWSVWWDRKIHAGKTFDAVISKELDAAKCVLVLWSPRSVESDWVKDEAAEAAKRKVLVPVLIDAVQIPLGFRRIQTAQLVGWNGDATDPNIAALHESIIALLGHGTELKSAEQSTAAREQSTDTRQENDVPSSEFGTDSEVAHGAPANGTTTPVPRFAHRGPGRYRWLKRTAAGALVIALALWGFDVYRSREQRALLAQRALAEANANIDRVSNKTKIRCNPLGVTDVDQWATIQVILPDSIDNSVDVSLNGKCRFSGTTTIVLYYVPYGSYEIRVFRKPFQEYVESVELATTHPSTKVQVKLAKYPK